MFAWPRLSILKKYLPGLGFLKNTYSHTCINEASKLCSKEYRFRVSSFILCGLCVCEHGYMCLNKGIL